MERPDITRFQREMAVTLLANAIRKDAHLRAQATPLREQGDPLIAAMARRRAEPSRRYAEGMRDLLRVLFTDGSTVAEECLEEAYARAVGASTAIGNNDIPYH